MKAPAGLATQSRAGWRSTVHGGDGSRQEAGLRGGAHGLRAGKHGSALRVLGGLARLTGGAFAKDAPINVGTQLLATDGAVCRLLNGRAVVCRDLPVAGLPLVDSGARYAQKARELCLGTNDGRSPVNGMG